MPVVLSVGNCQYAVLNGTGTATATTATTTTTINSGPGAPGPGIAQPGPPGAFYGFFSVGLGTYTATGTATTANSVVTAYDVVTLATSTTTATLCSGTMTAANALITPTGTSNPSWGVRYNGALVAVLTGASNSKVNALWD